MISNQNLKESLLRTVEFQNGLLFTIPALVHRQVKNKLFYIKNYNII